MNFLFILFCFILIAFFSNLSGKVVEKIKIPSLIGMMLFGLLVGPFGFNVIPNSVLNLSSLLKDLALITVLFIGGLGIGAEQIKKIGRPAILLSIVPATLEGFAIAFASTIFLDFTFIQGAILGFIIAAVSPAILIPSMVSLIDKKYGQNKSIPQLLLVGASADDTVAITLFTTFTSIYLSSVNNVSFNLHSQLITIPISICISLFVSWIVGLIASKTYLKSKNKYVKIIFSFIFYFLLRSIETYFKVTIFNSLLSIMFFGFFTRYYTKESYKEILDGVNHIWKYGKIYLFTFVGMAINPKLVGGYFFIGVIIFIFSLTIRSIGVLISLVGTNLNWKERIFCVIAYLPKATVQSAKAGIPLQMGIIGGEIMQAIAILSVLITAPIGAIGINSTYEKLLEKENIL